MQRAAMTQVRGDVAGGNAFSFFCGRCFICHALRSVHRPAAACPTACLQSALAKERRELREQQNRMLIEAIPKDLSKPWEDPLAGACGCEGAAG